MIRTWHILGLLLAFALAGGGCLGGDDGGGGGGGNAGGSGGSGGTGGNGGGDFTCGDIVTCFGDCGQSDQKCLNACLAKGRMISQEILLAYDDCLGRANTTCGGDQDCIQQACAGVAAACGADSGEGGDLTCAPLSQCVASCGGDTAQACVNACVGVSDQASAQLLQDVFDCRDANCQGAADVDACVRTNCADEVTACEGDR